MYEDNSAASSDEEWETRVLCSDESCIGVIGPDGRCKECGLEFRGALPASSEPARTEYPATGEDETETDEGLDEAAVTDQEWAQRMLCSDENCIGVIGPDGRCKECGRPYESARP